MPDVALKCAVQEGRLTTNPVPATVIRKVQRKSIQPMSDAMQAAPECYLHPRLEAIHRQIDCVPPDCGWFRTVPTRTTV